MKRAHAFLALALVALTFPVGLPFLGAEPIKVFLLGGQSNMVGQTKTKSLTGDFANFKKVKREVRIFSGADKVLGTSLEYLQPSLNSRPNNFGPELSFGHALSHFFPDTKIALIKYAQGGSFLATSSKSANAWLYPTVADPSVNNNAYSRFQKTVADGLRALEAAGFEPEIVGMMWHQGESNARTSDTIGKAGLEADQARYEKHLSDFIADIRSLYGSNLPFLIGEITIPDDRPGAAAVIAAQKAVADADSNAVFVPGDDLVTVDRWHFDTESIIKLGARFASAYARNFGSRME